MKEFWRRPLSLFLDHLRASGVLPPSPPPATATLIAELQEYLAFLREHRKGRAVREHQSHYLLSGLLFCGDCGAPMIIHGRTTSSTYRCPDHAKRGTCKNGLPVKERVVRARIVEAVRERLLSPGGLAYARKQIAERLGEVARTRSAEIDERVKRLQRTEARIGGLIQFISDGDQSPYVRTTLLDLEAQAKAEKASIAAI